MMDFGFTMHNGYITVQNTIRGTHRTFRIKRQKDNATFLPGQRILSILVGPNSTDDYQQIGTVDSDGIVKLWRRYDTPHFQKLVDVLQDRGKWEKVGVRYLYESRCLRCNRLLTTPASIQNGIGPECAKV